jgi:1,2-diacylglycerol 3-beta-glucosyltransferase
VLQGVIYAANIVVVLSMVYLISVMVSGRKHPLLTEGPTDYLTPIFIVPCLNEERVISQTLDRLLAVDRALVVVVDDGSDDATSSLIQERVARRPDRLLLVQRTLPQARLGKGAALNYGFTKLAAWVADKGISPDRTIVCVMDADGVIDPAAVDTVLPYFLDSKVGGCQILVRIRNRNRLIGRMQDVEFTTFTELVQTGRQNIGSSGLGGNGQFTRLRALQELGLQPWSDCLVEDLDLGLQLLAHGWQLRVCTETHVAQQGLESVSRLVRQRTRWVQGLFQTWRRIPAILAADLRLRAQLDILYALVFPGIVTIVWPVVVIVSHAYMLYLVFSAKAGATLGNGRWWITILVWYLFTFVPSHYLLSHYRRRTREISQWNAFLIAHVYALFQLIWYVAGWKALGRILTGRGGWVKTERYVEAIQKSPAVIDLTSEAAPLPPSAPSPAQTIVPKQTPSTQTRQPGE